MAALDLLFWLIVLVVLALVFRKIFAKKGTDRRDAVVEAARRVTERRVAARQPAHPTDTHDPNGAPRSAADETHNVR